MVLAIVVSASVVGLGFCRFGRGECGGEVADIVRVWNWREGGMERGGRRVGWGVASDAIAGMLTTSYFCERGRDNFIMH